MCLILALCFIVNCFNIVALIKKRYKGKIRDEELNKKIFTTTVCLFFLFVQGVNVFTNLIILFNGVVINSFLLLVFTLTVEILPTFFILHLFNPIKCCQKNCCNEYEPITQKSLSPENSRELDGSLFIKSLY